MVSQHRNIPRTSMITVKSKKPSQMLSINGDVLKTHQYTHIHSLLKNGWSGSLLFCSIILKSMVRKASLLITWPKWVHRYFNGVAEDFFRSIYINLSGWYLFSVTWQKFRKVIVIRNGLGKAHGLIFSKDLFRWADMRKRVVGKNHFRGSF